MSMRSPLGRARGLGVTKEGGARHWWRERMSSMALAPLALWFVFSMVSIVGADHAAYALWLGDPGNTLLMSLFVAAVFVHAGQGLTVVTEDYIHNEPVKIAMLIGIKAFVYLFGGASLLAIFKVAFGG
ncbi:MAG: succinate dehydrogenase, hydrophobic membrane anchor protein [Rhodospirillaceae bacterium]|nr:succinate dehydrogenase, hydrophobic membrane anchor protein [Rhodospirillaceae bacterium]